MSKKIMILGASILQLPAIEKAKEMGLDVIVVDMNQEAIGFAVPGIKKEIIISNMMTGYPQRYEYADGDYFICGVVVSVDEKSGICTSIKRIRY